MNGLGHRRACALLFAAVAATLAACSDGSDDGEGSASGSAVDAPHPPPATAIRRGRALVERFQCNRCHDLDGVDAAAPGQSCVGCHQSIEAGEFAADEADLEAWSENIHTLTAAPALISVGERLDRGWIARFLLAPHDLRPGLEATMPRLPIDADDARDIAAFLTREVGEPGAPTPPDDPALVATGRRLFGERACTECHRFRDAAMPERGRAIPDATGTLAPDLSATRERFRRDRLAAWIQHPRGLLASTSMPELGLGAGDARALAAYLLHAELAPEEERLAPPMLPLLERRVSYDEVERRVFHRTCRHCHADPDLAMGDGGPGNHGGFGFEARGLNLTNYEGAAAGVLVDGRRVSIYAPGDDGVPRLVRALRARQLEEAGEIDPEVRGMPLGLPALSAEEIQLVASWIAQGRPR